MPTFFAGSADNGLVTTQAAWPRCPRCGRRFKGEHPACGTVVAPRDGAPGEEAMPAVDGLAVERLLGRVAR